MTDPTPSPDPATTGPGESQVALERPEIVDQASVAGSRDARYGIISSVMAGLGRVMAEVGAVLIVGGNIAGYTRVMTTTIALEYAKGNFELAIALGIILLLISLFLNAALFLFQRKVYR